MYKASFYFIGLYGFILFIELYFYFSVSSSLLLIEACEVRECTVGTWAWRLDLHLEMLINNTLIIISNSGLLCLVIYRIMVLIQVIQRFIRIWTGCSVFPGWWIPSVISLAKTKFALRFNIRLDQQLSSHLRMRVRSWSWQSL